MTLWFSIEVRFLHGRYHGRDANAQPEWPPTPLRLFQAITAGALAGRWAVEDVERTRTLVALRWLEALGAPGCVLAVPKQALREYRIAVPNNQADRHIPALKKGALLDRLIAKDRELKAVRPQWVGRLPVTYTWPIPATAREQAEAVVPVVRRLVVLGTGLDHAVADARMATEPPGADGALCAHPPGAAPCIGTFDSLLKRHAAFLGRLAGGSLREGLPPVLSTAAASGSRDTQLIFALRKPAAKPDGARPVAPEASALLADAVRRQLVATLVTGLTRRPGSAPGVTVADMERLVGGLGAGPDDVRRRVRVSPLPSIGFEHADGFLRRLLVTVPASFPLSADTVRRALLQAEFEVAGVEPAPIRLRLLLADTEDDVERRMRDRYLGAAQVWRSVSPVVLPGRRGAARRSAPNETAEMTERRVRAELCDEADKAALFERALATAGVDGVSSFRLRREPFGPHQPRADAAWRLPTNWETPPRAWLAGRPRVHAEVVLAAPRSGPFLVGDGRFLGLGLFHAVHESADVLAFAIESGLTPAATPKLLTATLRRAVMARVRDHTGDARLDPFFTGHGPDGEPLRNGGHRHLAFVFDPAAARLLVIAPHRLEGREAAGAEHRHLGTLDAALAGLRELRAGAAGCLALRPTECGAADDRLLGVSRVWESVTPYVPTRHAKRLTPEAAVAEDVRRECRRRGWPEPSVDVVQARSGPRGGLSADLRLTFGMARAGPVLLGRDAHEGGGVFQVAPRAARNDAATA